MTRGAPFYYKMDHRMIGDMDLRSDRIPERKTSFLQTFIKESTHFPLRIMV